MQTQPLQKKKKKKNNKDEKEKKKILSEVGFEPTPTYVDQNASNSR